ncbi:unnamed protein product [Rhizophagus irregularis]|nr:unnamed protein product [Rhizophagus irregularis]
MILFLSVENIHITGSLDLLGRVGKYNIQKLGSKYTSLQPKRKSQKVALLRNRLSTESRERNYCSAFPKNESKQGQEEASIFRLKISTYYAYQTKAEETSYISLPKKDKRSVGSTKTKNHQQECGG